jgi:hypothetical protein
MIYSESDPSSVTRRPNYGAVNSVFFPFVRNLGLLEMLWTEEWYFLFYTNQISLTVLVIEDLHSLIHYFGNSINFSAQRVSFILTQQETCRCKHEKSNVLFFSQFKMCCKSFPVDQY